MSPRGILLRYASHDTRCIDFPRVEGYSTETPGLGRHIQQGLLYEMV